MVISGKTRTRILRGDFSSCVVNFCCDMTCEKFVCGWSPVGRWRSAASLETALQEPQSGSSIRALQLPICFSRDCVQNPGWACEWDSADDVVGRWRSFRNSHALGLAFIHAPLVVQIHQPVDVAVGLLVAAARVGLVSCGYIHDTCGVVAREANSVIWLNDIY